MQRYVLCKNFYQKRSEGAIKFKIIMKNYSPFEANTAGFEKFSNSNKKRNNNSKKPLSKGNKPSRGSKFENNYN